MQGGTVKAKSGAVRNRSASVCASAEPIPPSPFRLLPSRNAQPVAACGGLTLIELLVVMVILSLLVGAAIPVLSPASDSRRVREAARNINTYLTGAQTRAIETGRPFGVRLRKLSRDTGRAADNGVCVEMSYIEVPPPFAGFDENSRVMFGTDELASGAANSNLVLMRFVTAGNAVPQNSDGLPPGIDTDPIVPGFLRSGDTVAIAGRIFEIIDGANNGADLDSQGFYATGIGNPANSLFVTPVNATVLNLQYQFDNVGNLLTAPISQPSRYWTQPTSYQIFRQPTPTSNEPYQLPEGAAIDLRASGIGGVPFFEDDEFNGSDPTTPTSANATTSNRDPIDILFSPEGTIERLQFNLGIDGAAPTSEATTDTLFLLVGPSLTLPLQGTPAEADFGGAAGQGTDADIEERKANINWLNTESRWVTVGSRTGTVRTAENTFVDPVAIARSLPGFPGSLTQRRNLEIELARTLAAEGAQVGGR